MIYSLIFFILSSRESSLDKEEGDIKDSGFKKNEFEIFFPRKKSLMTITYL